MTARELPQDFHALYDTGARRARGTTLSATEQQTPAATGRLAPDPDDLQVDVDEATGLPNLVTGLPPTAHLVQRVDGVGSPGGPSPGSPSPSATASTLPSA